MSPRPAPAVPAGTVPSADLVGLVTETGSGPLGPGPWQSAFWVSVPGRVLSKSNHRNTRDSSWQQVSDYEALVHQLVRAARPADWPRPDRATPAADRPAVVVALVARTGLDAGNLSKSVLDAAEGAAYVTDAQVRSVSDLVVPSRTNMGLLAAFAVVAVDPDAHTLLAAQTALLSAVTALLPAPRTAP